MSLPRHYAKYAWMLLLLLVAYSVAAEDPPAASDAAKDLNIGMLFAALADGQFWLVLLVTIVFGALGGFVYELLTLQGMIERSHKPQKSEVSDFPHATHEFVYDLGIWGRLIIGSMAAVIALWIIPPDDRFSWVAISIVAGSAGTSIFQSMQNRLLAIIKSKQVSEQQTIIEDMDKTVREMEQASNKNDQAQVTRLAAGANALAQRRFR